MRPCTTHIKGHSALIGSVRRQCLFPRLNDIFSVKSAVRRWESSKPDPWAALENNRIVTSSPTSKRKKSKPDPWVALENKRIVTSSPTSKRRNRKDVKSKGRPQYSHLISKPRTGVLIERSRAPASGLVAKSRRQTAMSHDPLRAEKPISEFKVDSKERTIATIVGDLPVSPIMDPGFWDAKEKYKRSKPLKSDEPMYSVIKQFRKNPFAHALATPLRQCSMSKAHLPKFFLQNFNVLKHPQTQRPWWVPNLNPPDLPEEKEPDPTSDLTDPDFDPSLPSNPEQPDFSDPFSSDSASPVDLLDSQFSSQAAEAQQALAEKQHADLVLLRKYKTIPSGPKTNALARRDLFRAFTQFKSGFEGGENRILGAYSGKTRNMAAGAVWRVDMDSVVLDLLRQDIMADLIYIANLTLENKREKRHHIERVPGGWDGIERVRRGAVLWFGGPVSPGELAKERKAERVRKEHAEQEKLERKKEAAERAARDITSFLDPVPGEERLAVEDVSEAEKDVVETDKTPELAQEKSGHDEKRVPGPGPCAVLTLKGKTLLGDAKEEGILVHNIPHLLGPEHTARLRRDVRMFKKGNDLFVASGKKCTDLQVKLWKLQGYLTDYKTPLGWTWSHER